MYVSTSTSRQRWQWQHQWRSVGYLHIYTPVSLGGGRSVYTQPVMGIIQCRHALPTLQHSQILQKVFSSFIRWTQCNSAFVNGDYLIMGCRGFNKHKHSSWKCIPNSGGWCGDVVFRLSVCYHRKHQPVKIPFEWTHCWRKNLRLGFKHVQMSSPRRFLHLALNLGIRRRKIGHFILVLQKVASEGS